MDDITDVWIPLVAVFILIWIIAGINWWLVSVIVSLFVGRFIGLNTENPNLNRKDRIE